ncbi:MAG: UDP-N-acetylmuramoyl-L-alanyl-D-glutamate--2,6-diaminopimelate ligase [Candidatus Dependentiae bacterium ADurb.Bin331]|nr:MAG: UDP-N-acetylmuramoyl-L-alanyl-D-glutamate--2,6-diaminopimelate ligase [Candidatus Dependentiae bacterium ADurb.Bin331]
MEECIPAYYPVCCHTDRVKQGSVFVAVHGKKENGIHYIESAIDRGASIVVIDQLAELSVATQKKIEEHKVLLLKVENTRRALAQLSAHAVSYPARTLKIIGVTGTKGKTTTCFLLAHYLRAAGKKVALLSSVHNQINEEILPTELTTQHPDYLHLFFDACKKRAVEYVVMEVAAQAISLDRTFGLEFDGAIFTNFSAEHAEFYEDQESYFNAKCRLFSQTKKNSPIFINADDQSFEKIHALLPQAHFFALNKPNSFLQTTLNSCDWNGINLTVNETRVQFPTLIGAFNAYNAIAAISLAHALGIDLSTLAQASKTFTGVPGRLELYQLPNGARCVIDKAHNPSSFDAVLSTLRSLTDQLIVVFGAGGDRDKTKRPIMGALASHYGDFTIITSDNPRTEVLSVIIDAIVLGVDAKNKYKVCVISDREEAIRYAYSISKKGAIIALLGKGPDEYELVNGVKTHFSEREIVQSF